MRDAITARMKLDFDCTIQTSLCLRNRNVAFYGKDIVHNSRSIEIVLVLFDMGEDFIPSSCYSYTHDLISGTNFPSVYACLLYMLYFCDAVILVTFSLCKHNFFRFFCLLSPFIYSIGGNGKRPRTIICEINTRFIIIDVVVIATRLYLPFPLVDVTKYKKQKHIFHLSRIDINYLAMKGLFYRIKNQHKSFLLFKKKVPTCFVVAVYIAFHVLLPLSFFSLCFYCDQQKNRKWGKRTEAEMFNTVVVAQFLSSASSTKSVEFNLIALLLPIHAIELD